MKQMGRLLKPYWKTVLLIILAHIVQAYTTLLLPDYTSHLIDTGIQNSGIQYAVPLELTENAGAAFQQLLLPDELEAFHTYFKQDSSGTYQLEESVQKDDAQMRRLNNLFMTPLAISGFFDQLSDDQKTSMMLQQGLQKTSEQAFDVVSLRQNASDRLSDMGDQVIKSMAISFVAKQYQATGNDLNAYQMTYLLREGAIMLGVSLVMMTAAFLAHYYAAKIGAAIGHELRTKTFQQVLNFSQKEINQYSTASLITRTSNDIQQIQMVITMILRIALFSPVMAIGAIAHVIHTGSSMLWIVVVAILVILAIVMGLMAVTMPKFKLLQTQVDKVNRFAREILTGLQVIRAYGRQDLEAQRFDGANQELQQTNLFTNRMMSFMMPLMTIVMNLVSVLIIWVAGHHISNGTLQVGQMTAFLNYTMQIIFSFLMITMMAVMLPRAIVAMERVQEVIDQPLSIQDAEQVVQLDSPRGLIEFKDVSFRYEGADADTLQAINFVAAPGKTTAIIGATGSGKSTLLNLLLRFFEVSQGQITIDGVDIRHLSQHQLRDLIGYVPQKGILFSGTIASNIAYGEPHLSESALVEAAEIAHASEFIEAKSEGYQSAIAQGGANVSGGQKQRLAIARAIAKNPKIYLFDDAFSALDYRTDVSLRSALASKTQEATVLIVAQRVSTILHADQIIVLDEGRIVGVGDHHSLMHQSAVYREIASSQLSQEELEREATRYQTTRPALEEGV